MDPMDDIKETYFQECEELLPAMEEGLLAIEQGETDAETINAVFRAVHSIKGGGGAFGFDSLVAFAHVFETVLDRVRSNELAVDPDIAKVLLKAGDVLADHVSAARKGEARAPESDEEVLAALRNLTDEDAEDASGGAEADIEGLDFKPMMISVDDDDEDEPAAAEPGGWRIRFAPHAALYANANEPQLIIRELQSLGEVEVVADLSKLPELHKIEPEGAYLAWDITLKGAVERERVAEAFDWVSGDCDLQIEPIAAAGEAAAESETPVDTNDSEPAAPAPKQKGAKPAPEMRKEAPAAAGGESTVRATIRVDPEKVDRLVNLVGELVIAQAMISQRIQEAGIPASSPLANGLVELEHLLRELQESVMAVRTQPVKSVFQRMPRLVRELGSQTGKEVRLVVEGEGTEVDKTVIERLAEPLTHMIRNAIDHGLETGEERSSVGKPAEGIVKLSAEHRGGRIVIEVRDDGRGINRERVRQKALDNGLISHNAVLSDNDVDNLIFMPGFTTANQVSNISGRGVGMDVVRRNIVELGGRIVINSTPGKGSVFSLTLPLTLAVLDGMVISVGDQTFVVPLTHVVESLQPGEADVRAFGRDQNLMQIRGAHVPIVLLGHLLGIAEAQTDPTKAVVILVESEGTGQLALVADSIVGQRQVVIKSFEANYRRIEGIAAATILGDGRVAFILDVDGLVARYRGARGTPRPIDDMAIGRAS